MKQSWLSVSLNCLWKRYNHISSTPETAAVHVRILWFALYVEILLGNLCIPTSHITPGGGRGRFWAEEHAYPFKGENTIEPTPENFKIAEI